MTEPLNCPDTENGGEHLFDIRQPVQPDNFRMTCNCGKFIIVMDDTLEFVCKKAE